ncbi:MAG: hypothetical protein A2020_11260 [Lentisphaerae bacterium GWF2_45_14]|nr:MAG: hypothetical protein A2020_11260 [Lentisphaerae bacterium GWF2_45_14]
MINKRILIATLVTVALSLSAGERYKDGTYRAEADGYEDKIIVDVTVKADKITNVKIVSQAESRAKTSMKAIPERILQVQKSKVDAVTGATVSSKAIIKAVDKALKKALVKKTAAAPCKGKN